MLNRASADTGAVASLMAAAFAVWGWAANAAVDAERAVGGCVPVARAGVGLGETADVAVESLRLGVAAVQEHAAAAVGGPSFAGPAACALKQAH